MSNDISQVGVVEVTADEELPDLPLCTDEELAQAFTRNCCKAAEYWSTVENVTDEQRVNGAIGDVLNLLDGRVPGFPQMQLLSPKHGDHTCIVERNGRLVEVGVGRFTSFYGGYYGEFIHLRTEAATAMPKD